MGTFCGEYRVELDKTDLRVYEFLRKNRRRFVTALEIVEHIYAGRKKPKRAIDAVRRSIGRLRKLRGAPISAGFAYCLDDSLVRKK